MFGKLCENMQKYEKICKNMQKYAKVSLLYGDLASYPNKIKHLDRECTNPLCRSILSCPASLQLIKKATVQHI